MLYKGHMAAGAIIAPAVTATLLTLNNVEPVHTTAACAIASCASFVTSLLPDLDSKTSKIFRIFKAASTIFFVLSYIIMCMGAASYDMKNIIKNISVIIAVIFIISSLGHRKILHSIWAAVAIVFICSTYIGFNTLIKAGITFGFIFGYLSHLWCDTHTTDGIQIFYPFKFTLRLGNFESGKDDLKILLIIICEFAAIGFAISKRNEIKAMVLSLYEIIKVKFYELIDI